VSAFDNLSEPVKHWLDIGAIGGVVATLFGWVPQIAALLSVIWICLRITNELLDRAIKRQTYELNKRKLRGDE
jgi:uncharacterized membrane protein YciS (DUF1049 family)